MCIDSFVSRPVANLANAATQMKLTSAFGAFLDPVADKLMVSTVLILLAVRTLARVSCFDTHMCQLGSCVGLQTRP